MQRDCFEVDNERRKSWLTSSWNVLSEDFRYFPKQNRKQVFIIPPLLTRKYDIQNKSGGKKNGGNNFQC